MSRFEGHTPAPWYFEADKGIAGHWTVWADVGGVKVFIADCYEGDQAKIDARLIAAAPDMHGACEKFDRLSLVIESAVRHADPDNHDAVVALIKANRAALAKEPAS